MVGMPAFLKLRLRWLSAMAGDHGAYRLAVAGLSCLLNLVPAYHTAQAEEVPGLDKPAFVSIVIDDLGYRLRDGLRAVNLPATISYSFLPHTPFANRLATLAHDRGSEIILHVPMESLDGRPLGPGGLTGKMPHRELVTTINAGLASMPFASGVSNHMGSLLTSRPEAMQWLMQTLKQRSDLFFMDSRTTTGSVALDSARKAGIPSLSRDVFLDHDPSPLKIAQQFQHLIMLAKERGTALGVGHPYPETMEVLEGLLPTLRKKGVRIVKVTELIEIRKRPLQWQLSLFHSLKAAKN